MIFGRTKGEMAEKLWKDSEGGPLKFARKMKTCGGWGTRQSSKVLGGITSVKLHSKGGSAEFLSPGDEK